MYSYPKPKNILRIIFYKKKPNNFKLNRSRPTALKKWLEQAKAKLPALSDAHTHTRSTYYGEWHRQLARGVAQSEQNARDAHQFGALCLRRCVFNALRQRGKWASERATPRMGDGGDDYDDDSEAATLHSRWIRYCCCTRSWTWTCPGSTASFRTCCTRPPSPTSLPLSACLSAYLCVTILHINCIKL